MKNIVRNCAIFFAVILIGATALFFAVKMGGGGVPAAFGTAVSKEVTDSVSVEVASLKYGSSGSQVKTVQKKLKNWGYYSGDVDGIYGSATVKAVKYFQEKNSLTVDGICGPATLKAMGISTSSSSSTSSTKYSSSDVYLLAKVIYAEGRGESYTGQVAIGAVVLNRVKSSSFPNTISGVVYQKGAFTAVSDGQINLEPDSTAIAAAKDAMNGWDPTYGCLYYYNPAIATSSWIFSRQTVTIIGKHVFAI